MSFLSSLFDTVFFEPLFNALVFLVGLVPFNDVGLAIIILTVVVRFIIFPLNHKAIIAQTKIKQLEPEIKDIKEKYKKDAQAQAQKTMELYRSHGVNPFSGFITLLIQIPLIIALYKVFSSGIGFNPEHLYSFVNIPETINAKFLGIFDLTKNNYILGFLTGLTQFIQMRLAIPPVKKIKSGGSSFKDELARNMNIQMRYIMPVIVLFVASRFISAIAVYWTTMNIFAIIHEAIVRKKAKKIMEKNNGTIGPNPNNKNTGGSSSEENVS